MTFDLSEHSTKSHKLSATFQTTQADRCPWAAVMRDAIPLAYLMHMYRSLHKCTFGQIHLPFDEPCSASCAPLHVRCTVEARRTRDISDRWSELGSLPRNINGALIHRECTRRAWCHVWHRRTVTISRGARTTRGCCRGNSSVNYIDGIVSSGFKTRFKTSLSLFLSLGQNFAGDISLFCAYSCPIMMPLWNAQRASTSR